MIVATLLYLQVGLFGADPQLTVLVTQTSQQILEIQKLLKEVGKTSEAVDGALKIAQEAQKGIDAAMKIRRNTRSFSRAVENVARARSIKDARWAIQDSKDYWEYYRGLFPERAEAMEREDESRSARDDLLVERRTEILRELQELTREMDQNPSPGRSQQIALEVQMRILQEQILTREIIAESLRTNESMLDIERSRVEGEAVEALEAEKGLRDFFQKRGRSR
jgi:hypothetical protein